VGGEEAMSQSKKPDIAALITKAATQATRKFLKMKVEKMYMLGALMAEETYYAVKKEVKGR
jgi:hypothetical protein